MNQAREAVPAHLRGLLTKLGKGHLTQDFYLAGGTGLALLLNHRRSVDLDFFSRTNKLDFNGRRSLFARLKKFHNWTLIEVKEGTVHGQMGRVRMSFFWYDVLLVKPLLKREGVPVASMEDIGLMKVAAIIGRGSRKDFYDLYAICQRIPPSRLLRMGQKKFKNFRDFTLQALKALVFFEDAEKEAAIQPLKPLSWDQVKSYFERQVHAIIRDRLLS